MGRIKNEINVGDVFGRLTVINSKPPKDPSRKPGRYIECQCSCGEQCLVDAHKLYTGHTRSCGCFMRESRGKSSITHGNCGNRLFDVWRAMKSRCENPSDGNYDHYGARGITVCERWSGSFDAFLEDMLGAYEEGLTLDREDNSLGYSKQNCRWVNMSVQGHNKRHKVRETTNMIGVFEIECGYNTYINYNRRRCYLHVWKTESESAKAYDDASELLYGDRPNHTPQAEDYIKDKVVKKLRSKGFLPVS